MGGGRRKPGKTIILFIFIILLTGIALLIIRNAWPDPPLNDISKALTALSLAGNKEAGKYASNQYSLAKTLWDSLMTDWRYQNSLPFYKRNYENLVLLSKQIELQAINATSSALTGKETIKLTLDNKLKRTHEIISRFDTSYSKLPLNKTFRADISKAKILYRESEVNLQRGNLLQASEILRECQEITENCDSQVNAWIRNYFEAFPEWEKWIKQTIYQSRQNQSVAIIVDKFEHKCYVYKKGKVIAEYNAEFGPNWIGDKNYSGDKATPEGKYFITRKLGQKETRYYKALLLNYPNTDDLSRFKEALKNGTIPPGKNIGNLIEIHGDGGKGMNWTDGCIALENKCMDELFSLANTGNPVVIVGSMNPLPDISW